MYTYLFCLLGGLAPSAMSHAALPRILAVCHFKGGGRPHFIAFSRPARGYGTGWETGCETGLQAKRHKQNP